MCTRNRRRHRRRVPEQHNFWRMTKTLPNLLDHRLLDGSVPEQISNARVPATAYGLRAAGYMRSADIIFHLISRKLCCEPINAVISPPSVFERLHLESGADQKWKMETLATNTKPHICQSETASPCRKVVAMQPWYYPILPAHILLHPNTCTHRDC